MTDLDQTSRRISYSLADLDLGVLDRQYFGQIPVRKPNYRLLAEQTMRGSIALPHHPVWVTNNPLNWTADPFEDRNWQFQHHTLRWLNPVRHLALDGNTDARDYWISASRSWVENNPVGRSRSKFAWRDMVDAHRAIEFVFGLSLMGADESEWLVQSLVDHGEWLVDERHLATRNHALHQHQGLLVLGALFRNESWIDLAERRMVKQFVLSFDEQGANDEGSAGYHRLNLVWWEQAWKRLSAEGRAVPDVVSTRLEAAREVLVHLTRPDGTLVQIGDTNRSLVRMESTPHLTYVSSGGVEGVAPAEQTKILGRGYALGRSGWGRGERSFSQETFYSLRFGDPEVSHAHSDRGSVTFYATGVDWLTDSGFYNYQFGDPFREYLKSRLAHNVVHLPGGSYDKSGEVPLVRHVIHDDFHDFTIRDDNYEGCSILRRVVYLPDPDAMLVIDNVATPQDTEVEQLWHVSPNIKPRYRDQGFELQGDGRSSALFWLGDKPRLQLHKADNNSETGWISRKWGDKSPGSTITATKAGPDTQFVTLIAPSRPDDLGVVGSRVTKSGVWLKLQRSSARWSINITMDGVSVDKVLASEPTSPREDVSASDGQFTPAKAEVVGATTDIRSGPPITTAFEQGLLAGHVESRLREAQDKALEAREYAEQKAGSHFALIKKLDKRVSDLEKNWSKRLRESEAAAKKERTALHVEVKKLKSAQDKTLEEQVDRLAAVLPLLPAGTDIAPLLGSLSLREVMSRITDPLFLYELVDSGYGSKHLNLTARRRLSRELYRKGYLTKSLQVLENIVQDTKSDKDISILENRRAELEFMSGQRSVPPVQEPEASYSGVPARVLHVVGKALPETQTGYTLRTHYLGRALHDKGFDVGVFRQVGGVEEAHAEEHVSLNGVAYFLPRGPLRGQVPWTDWMRANAVALAHCVETFRPMVLHAHSDFLNFQIARAVADAYGIPVLYESRGFWEESWLSRTENAHGTSLQPEIDRYGMPDSYTWRRAREDEARAAADAVTTLARVMREHIIDRGLPAENIHVTPNGVDVDQFPVVAPDEDLKKGLGLSPETVVIGYITSVVEYEGIDILIRAFFALRSGREDVHLLLVGDGPVRTQLEGLVADLGLEEHTTFTGRVAHEDVLRYYSIIDLFVVPRRDRTVCQLVTPLKPFEAFSTGRTVVMSNVRALQEIAEDSQAAMTFEADNADSLAEVLKHLLDNPAVRAELAERGAEWVREARSWASIADLYDEPYASLGLRPYSSLDDWDPILNGTLAIDHVRRHLDPGTRVNALRFLHMHGEAANEPSVDDARRVMISGWAGHGFPRVDLSHPVRWRELGNDDRTWQMHIHGWEFMEPVLEAWVATGEEEYLTWCVSRALSWAEEFSHVDNESMAWYDMAVAYRSVVLLSLLKACAASSAVPGDDFTRLVRVALRQRDAHWSDSSFNARNNHGYYAAASQTVFGRELTCLPGMRPLERQGRERLDIMTTSQFLPDGGHCEHSADYHRMLLGSFEGAIRCGAIDDEAITRLIGRAAENLGWMIQPNGFLIQLGDSPERQMIQKTRSSISPTTDWILSLGTRGEVPAEQMKVLHDTGYAFVRSPLPGDDTPFSETSYLALTCAFHTRTHKHADDQSVVWYDRGREILIDAGRFRYGELLDADSPLRAQGFYYSDPMRQYMESCPAHNTVSLDSDIHDRRRAPYGSGIQDAVQHEDGSFAISALAPHGHWSHERRVSFRPGVELVVDDHIAVADSENHTAYTWFLLDGALDLSTAADGSLVIRSDTWADALVVSHSSVDAELTVCRAQEGDQIRGFRSRKDRTVEPAWSVCWAHQMTHELKTTTRFAYTSDGLVVEDGDPEQPNTQGSDDIGAS